jgi:hypothetical protein
MAYFQVDRSPAVGLPSCVLPATFEDQITWSNTGGMIGGCTSGCAP